VSGGRTGPTTSGVYGVAEVTTGYSLAASFPHDATATTLASSLGTYYVITQTSNQSWQLTARENGTQATITLASNLTFEAQWEGTLDLSTWAMYLEFAIANSDSITRTFEVQVTEPALRPIKALSISCEVRRDVIDVSNITAAATGQYAYFNNSVTGYTGGGATNLDGLSTLTRAVPVLLAFDHATDGGVVFKLRAGTDAESSPSLIRPDDYNAVTNAKVWQFFS
jgi:hypothetical protein